MGETKPVFNGAQEGRHTPPIVTGATAEGVTTQATITLSAVANSRNVLSYLTATLTPTAWAAAVSSVGVNVIDGASGGTTYLWRGGIAIDTTGPTPLIVPNMHLAGSINTAMTIEFTGDVVDAVERLSVGYYTIR